jgi:hypothetical protein
VDVLLRPDQEPTPELLAEVTKYVHAFESRIRKDSSTKAIAGRAEAQQLLMLPTVQQAVSLLPGSRWDRGASRVCGCAECLAFLLLLPPPLPLLVVPSPPSSPLAPFLFPLRRLRRGDPSQQPTDDGAGAGLSSSAPQVEGGMPAMSRNGYIPAKMVRAQLLHYAICRLVGE